MMQTIPGLDCAKGLANVAGMAELYEEVLAAFVSDVEEKADGLRILAASKDFDGFRTLAHAFKSAARSIGADEIGEQAYRLEIAGRDADVAAIEGEVASFVENLVALKDGIRDALKA
ncbi:MAG: Hpt domain-containing protein [Clostridiales Family XIII bacterium]|jgi:HPt (histidine-containing phosphotransfer) domain-containing protein|nr:Hpt domain-containing protein [Clostridiales Family XIII bacterium]